MHGMVSDIGLARAGPMSGEFEHDRLIEAVARDRDREAFAVLFDHFAPRLKAWLMRSSRARRSQAAGSNAGSSTMRRPA